MDLTKRVFVAWKNGYNLSSQPKVTVYLHLSLLYDAHSCYADQVIPPKDGDYSVQEIKCTMKQVLDEANKPDGHILNCLNFPLSLAGIHATGLSSCVEAFQATKGQPYCPDETGYPVPHFAWGLMSCKGARHVQHIDAAGANTSRSEEHTSELQ